MDEAVILRLGIDTAEQVAADELDERAFAENLLGLFRADAGVSVSHWDGSAWGSTPVRAVVAGCDELTREMAERAALYTTTHPSWVGMRRVGTTAPIRLSDEVPLPRFWGTDAYEALQGHIHSRFPMSALLHADRRTPALIALHRRHRDFTDEEMVLLARLQQPIAAAYKYRAALDIAAARISALYGDTSASESVGDEKGPRESPTRREAEVVALMAAGWTNIQIATRLHITERTVRKHLSAVYDKAHLPGRAAAATWWICHRDDFAEH